MRITLLVLAGLATACGPSPALQPEPASPVEIAAEPIGRTTTPPRAGRGGYKPRPVGRLAAGTTYTGHYVCAQGETGMTLQIQEVQGPQIHGVFEFFHEPSQAHGSFSVDGFLGQNGEITFEPVAWIERPPRYVAVPFRLAVSEDGEHLKGGVLHPSCGEMEASRNR